MRLDPSTIKSLLGQWVVPGTMLGSALAIRLGELIDQGALPAGAQLPAQRPLGQALNISHNTVGSAYQLLQMEGFLDPRNSICRTGQGARTL